MKIFKKHVLPILLALSMIVVGGGAMFFVMRFGFSFQNRIVAHDLPEAGTLYSPAPQIKLTDTNIWSAFKSAEAKSFVNDMPDDTVTGDEYKILSNVKAEASALARFFLGRTTTDPSEITVDLSRAKYAVTYYNESYWINNIEYDPPAVYVDNCIVSFDLENEKFGLRFIYRGSSELIFFEFENLSDREYTADDVNSAYRIITSETESFVLGNDYINTPYTLLNDQDIIYKLRYDLDVDDANGEESDRFINFETYRFEYPISYYLVIYGMLGYYRNSEPEYTKSNLSLYLSRYSPQITYTDGYIYISYGYVDEKGGVILKYSVADRCITGMCAY